MYLILPPTHERKHPLARNNNIPQLRPSLSQPHHSNLLHIDHLNPSNLYQLAALDLEIEAAFLAVAEGEECVFEAVEVY